MTDSGEWRDRLRVEGSRIRAVDFGYWDGMTVDELDVAEHRFKSHLSLMRRVFWTRTLLLFGGSVIVAAAVLSLVWQIGKRTGAWGEYIVGALLVATTVLAIEAKKRGRLTRFDEWTRETAAARALIDVDLGTLRDIRRFRLTAKAPLE